MSDTKPPTPEPIRTAIIAAFEASGLTQQQLAAASGVTQAKISDYLAGKVQLSGANIERLAHALGVHLED